MSDYSTEYSFSQFNSNNSLYHTLYEEDEPTNSNIDSLSLKEFLDIFPDFTDNRQEEEIHNIDQIYFTKDSEKNKNITALPTAPSLKKNPFSVTIVPQKENDELTGKKRKRGRQVEVSDSTAGKSQKTHDKFSTDNLLRKIQVHYISFLISFINEILKALNFKQQFFKLDYKFKRNVNKNIFEALKDKKLSDIICNKISDKYKEQDKLANFKIYDQLKNEKVLEKLFNEKYFYFFKNYYYKSLKKINLNNYGLDKEIILSDTKSYKDLLEDIKKDPDANNKQYIENMNLCISQNYLKDKFFMN